MDKRHRGLKAEMQMASHDEGAASILPEIPAQPVPDSDPKVESIMLSTDDLRVLGREELIKEARRVTRIIETLTAYKGRIRVAIAESKQAERRG